MARYEKAGDEFYGILIEQMTESHQELLMYLPFAEPVAEQIGK